LLQKNLHEWPLEPGAKFHKRDGSQEHAVRQNASVALALALLASSGGLDHGIADATRAASPGGRHRVDRYLSITHAANFLPTGDGKKWGDQWQSAFWAGLAGQAAWLVWDKLARTTPRSWS